MLWYLIHLKEKRIGDVKARGCTDGRPQRIYTAKEETTAPTVTLGGLIITCTIDAFEQQDVVTLDIPRAFLQTKMSEDEEVVHVVLEGWMAELITKRDPPTYQEYVHKRHGQACIYVKLNVALYVTLKAAILFWKKLSNSLKGQGFKINLYN